MAWGDRVSGSAPTVTPAATPSGWGSRVAPSAQGGGSNVAGRFWGGFKRDVSGFIPGVKELVTTNPLPTLEQVALENFYAATGQTDKAEAARMKARGTPLAKNIILPELAAYKQKYISRDVLGNVWADPFGTALDATLVGSLGLGRAFALGTLPEGGSVAKALATGRYQGPLRTITVDAGSTGKVATRTLPRRGAQAGRMLFTDRLLKSLPDETPVVGQYARAARATLNETRQIELRLLASPEYEAYQKAYSRLSVRQRVALHALNRVPLAADLEAWKAMIPADDKAAQRLSRQLADPKIRAVYDEGLANPKIAAAHAAGTALSDLRTAIQVEHGNLSPEVAAEAPYRHTRVARGAVFVPETAARLGKVSPRQEFQARRVAELERLHGKALQQARRNAAAVIAGLPSRATVAEKEAALAALPEGSVPGIVGGKIVHEGRLISAHGSARAEKLGAALSVARDKLERLHAQAAARVEPTGLVGGPSVEQIRAEIEAAGRPQPFYEPDKMAQRGLGFTGRSSGRTTPKSDVHEWQGDLFRRGLIALTHDTLGPSFVRAAVYARAVETHRIVRSLATPSDTGRLAHGFRWVKETRPQIADRLLEAGATPDEVQAALRKGQPGHVGTNYGEHVHNVDETLPSDLRVTLDDTGDNPAGAARDLQGRYLMVPERFAKTLEADLAKGHTMLAKLVEFPLQVWRALILKLRVPWLENNIVGNTIMATLRFGGAHGLVAVLGMIEETKGVRAARNALGLAERNGQHLSDELLKAKLPELGRAGTFYGENLPTGTLARFPRAQRALRGPSRLLDLLPGIDRRTEGALRRAAAETVLRGSEEVQALYRAMPRQTRSWAAAFEKGLENEDLRRLVVREVNDAMGNFLSLTVHERGALRNVIPFYAWFREITRITLKLPIDAPGRAVALTQLGQIGAAHNDELLGALPSYLQGVVGIGKAKGDLQRILALRGANPYTSAVDVLSGRNPVGELNPFIGAIATYLGAKYTDKPANLYGVIPHAVLDTITKTPEYRLYSTRESRLYPTRTQEQMVWQFLGDYRRQISLQQAHYYASQGQ